MDVFNIGVELWIGYWLFSVADYRRFHRKWVRWLEYVMFFGLLGINNLGNRMMGVRFSNFLNITTVILYFICALVFTNRSWAACLAWGSIYYMSVAVLELPGIALTGWIVGIPYVYCVTENYIYDYIYLVIMSVFLLVIVRIWGNAFRKRLERLFYGRMNIFWLMFSVVEWWIV